MPRVVKCNELNTSRQILVSRPKLEIGRIMKHQKHWLMAVLAMAANLSMAQDTIDINATTVEAYRSATPLMSSARNITLLTQKDIQQLPVQSVQELLQHVGGIDLQQRGAWGTQADVSIRGGSFDQALVLINGLKINDPQSGHHHLNFDFALADIERIEVIKGPAAARYGVNAFNGVINIITKTTVEPALNAELQVARSADQLESAYHGHRVAVSGNFGSERLQQRVGLSTQLTNGYRPMTESQRHAFQYTARSHHKLGQTEALAFLCDNDFGASGFYAWPIDSSSTERVQTAYAGIQHRITKAQWQFMANVYHRFNRDVYTLFRAAPEVYQNNHLTNTSGATIEGAFYSSIGRISLGAEQRSERINSSNLGIHAHHNTGVFASHRHQWWNERIQSMVSIYSNFSPNHYPQWLPAAELSAKVTDQLRAFASWGSALRTPTFTDRYYQGPTNIGNPQLQPERANSYEAGIKWRTRVHFAQLSGFQRMATDLIDWVRPSETSPWQPQNYTGVITRGLDANYSIQRAIRLTENLNIPLIRFNYLYLNSDVQASEGMESRYSLNHLDHLASAQVAIAWSKGWSLVATTIMRSKPGKPVEWMMDTRLQYQRSAFRGWLDVTNLLNESFVQAGTAPLPGRWARAGLSYNFSRG